MTLDDLELLQVRIFLEFHAISYIWKATTANFPAKCVNITRQLALTAAAFYNSLISRHFSCFDKKKQV